MVTSTHDLFRMGEYFSYAVNKQTSRLSKVLYKILQSHYRFDHIYRYGAVWIIHKACLWKLQIWKESKKW